MILCTECDKCNVNDSFALYQDIIFLDTVTKNLIERITVTVCLHSKSSLLLVQKMNHACGKFILSILLVYRYYKDLKCQFS